MRLSITVALVSVVATGITGCSRGEVDTPESGAADRAAPSSNPAPPPASSGPLETMKVGDCRITTIETIGPRLEPMDGQEPQGTTVSYANGLIQISYEREAAVLASEVGDPVEVCLVSVPENCPPGDDRGKFYSARNSRTGGEWSLPDSQHMCGGA